LLPSDGSRLSPDANSAQEADAVHGGGSPIPALLRSDGTGACYRRRADALESVRVLMAIQSNFSTNAGAAGGGSS
jgi:hypothetical protein